MKKAIWFILILCLIAVNYTAFADAGDTPVRFRSFEWYTEYPVVLEALETDAGQRATFQFGNDRFTPNTGMATMVFPDGNFNNMSGCGAFFFVNGLSVAGYSASASVYCIDPMDGNGSLLHDDSKTQLVHAEYSFSEDDYPELSEVYSGILGGMKKAYGDPETSVDGTYTRFAIWKDGEGNIARLIYRNESSYSGEFTQKLRLSYSAADSLDRIVAVEDAVRDEEIRRLQEEQDKLNSSIDPGSTDGL